MQELDDDITREQVRRKVLPYGKKSHVIDRLRHARGTVGWSLMTNYTILTIFTVDLLLSLKCKLQTVFLEELSPRAQNIQTSLQRWTKAF